MIYSPENDAAGDAHQEILNAERKRTRQLEADMDALRCTHVAEMDAAQSANQKLTSEFNTLKELCEEQQKQLAQLAEKLNALANSSEATSPGKETEQPSPPETLPSPPNPPMEHAARAYLESKLASSASPDVIPSPSCPGGADMAPADMAPPPPAWAFLYRLTKKKTCNEAIYNAWHAGGVSFACELVLLVVVEHFEGLDGESAKIEAMYRLRQMSKQWRRGIQGFEESESKDLKKKPTSGLPPIEGDETYAQFTNKYKKAMLNRRQVYKDVSERLSSEGCSNFQNMVNIVKFATYTLHKCLSWGELQIGSHRHCFLWASMPHKLYSAAHKGFELGNAVIDSLMAEFAIQARGVPQRLTKAYSVCACFCKQVLKESPHLKIFTKENLHWSSLASMPDSTMKASDVAMFLKWLCDYMSGPIEFDDVLELAFKAVCSMDDFMRLVYTADRIWLTRAEATQDWSLEFISKKYAPEVAKIRELCKELPEDYDDIKLMRYAMQHPGKPEDAAANVKEVLAWRQGEGAQLCEAAAKAIEKAQEGGGWDNAPVLAAAPYADKISKYITPSQMVVVSTKVGDLVTCIRASTIDSEALMKEVSEEEMTEFFIYAREVNSAIAELRTRAGHVCRLISANDLTGVSKFPDQAFQNALTGSAKKAPTVRPAQR
ncbi:CRAL-TRIO domain-containing protein [Durusdinium trenchii]|uniref:CRAL-TRIO domain-containing protein n=1 Tax=Durusdinium trenchii TaxID=1381693 RepID=A0ABP0Q8P0_9DINO